MNLFYCFYFGNTCLCFISLAFSNFPLKRLICLFYAEVEEEKMFLFYSNNSVAVPLSLAIIILKLIIAQTL